uniref:Putative ml domain protein n=1 Tax=Ornithodoros turicata TaxID=34597 RepID=A0A2R5L5K9_9ACAR
MASSRFSCNAVFCGLVLFAAVLVLTVQATGSGRRFRTFQPCNSTKYSTLPAKLFLKGCEEKPVCPLYRGDSVTMEVQFVSPIDTTSVYRSMYGCFGASRRRRETRVRYGREVNVCNVTASASGESCTQNHGLKQGVEYIQSGTFRVMQYFPKVSVNVEIELYAKERRIVKPLACVRVPVQIMDRS